MILSKIRQISSLLLIKMLSVLLHPSSPWWPFCFVIYKVGECFLTRLKPWNFLNKFLLKNEDLKYKLNITTA